MLAPSPVVKKTAKTILSQCFLSAVMVCCLFLFVFFIGDLIASMISFFAHTLGYAIALTLLVVFAVAPLALGVLYYFRRLIWDSNDSVLVIFKYFSTLDEYKRAMHFVLLFFVKLLSVSLIAFSPCIIVWLLSTDFIYKLLGVSLPIWASNLWTINSFLLIVASFVVLFIMLKYYLSPFVFVANDTVDPYEAINMSSIISKRTGGDFFGLVLSFSGWILLSVLIAPLIFTLPYFLTSYCVHCRFAITAYNRDVDRFNSAYTPSFSTNEL